MMDFTTKTLPAGFSPKHPDYRHLLPAEIGDVEPLAPKDRPPSRYMVVSEWGDCRALDYVVGAV